MFYNKLLLNWSITATRETRSKRRRGLHDALHPGVITGKIYFFLNVNEMVPWRFFWRWMSLGEMLYTISIYGWSCFRKFYYWTERNVSLAKGRTKKHWCCMITFKNYTFLACSTAFSFFSGKRRRKWNQVRSFPVAKKGKKTRDEND